MTRARVKLRPCDYGGHNNDSFYPFGHAAEYISSLVVQNCSILSQEDQYTVVIAKQCLTFFQVRLIKLIFCLVSARIDYDRTPKKVAKPDRLHRLQHCKLFCYASGNPRPSFIWKHENGSIVQNLSDFTK